MLTIKILSWTDNDHLMKEMKKIIRDLSNPEFSFKYTELGGITSRYLLVSYNSKTNILTSSSDVTGSNITQKQPSESDEQELKEVVRENEFFKTRTDYPPEKEDENLAHIH